MNLEPVTIGTYEVNGKVRYLRVMQNADGTWTAGSPHAMRDFAKRGFAVRWLKKIYGRPGVKVTWLE